MLVLELELEALTSLRERGVEIVEDAVVELLEDRVKSTSTDGFWDFGTDLKVGEGDLLEVAGLKLREGLAEEVVVSSCHISVGNHGLESVEKFLVGSVKVRGYQLQKLKLAEYSFKIAEEASHYLFVSLAVIERVPQFVKEGKLSLGKSLHLVSRTKERKTLVLRNWVTLLRVLVIHVWSHDPLLSRCWPSQS